jgi:hypothetical protein
MLTSMGNNGSSSTQRLTRDLRDASSAGKNVGRDISRSASTASSALQAAGSGGGFFSSILNDIGKGAEGAGEKIDYLHNISAVMGTAIPTLVGGLSAAAQGLFAVGANAAAAAPALSVFANGLIGIGQIGGVVAIAMKGVGSAIQLGFKGITAQATAASGATTGLGNAVAAAARGVRNAKQGLQTAYQDAARSAEDAARRTADAEKALATATQATATAQKDLNAAYAVGYEQLKQIGFAAEQSSLDQANAALNLQDAQDALAATSELAADDPARVKAILEYKQADLTYREAKDAHAQADKASAKAAKEGVKGTDAVTSAQQNLTQAQQNQNKATQALADARRQQARTAQDNAKKIAAAQQSLADAENNLAQAQKTNAAGSTRAATAMAAYNAALKKLGPNQREFVTRIVGMHKQFQAFRNAVAEPLFGKLNTALDTLSRKGPDQKTFFDVLQTGLKGTSSALGDAGKHAATLAGNDLFQQKLARVMRTNNGAISKLGDAGVDLADAFVSVADAARPLVRDLTNWIAKLADAAEKTTNTKDRTGELTKTFKTAEQRVREFWGLTKELWKTLSILGHAANDAANGFENINKKGKGPTGFIPVLTQNLHEFNKTLKNKDLVDGFTAALHNMYSVGKVIGTILRPLIKIGQDPNIGKAFDKLASSKALDQIAATSTQAAPALADLAVSLGNILAALSGSGSAQAFIGVLAIFARGLAFITDHVDPKIIEAVGFAFGTWRALKFLGGAGKFLTGGLFGDIRKIPGNVSNAATGIANTSGKFTTAAKDVTAGFQLGWKEGVAEIGRQIGTTGEKLYLKFKEGSAESQFVKAGRDMAAGIALGVEAAGPAIGEALVAAAKAGMAEMKAVLGIRSPSTVGMKVGRDLMSGVTLGIEEGEAGTVAAAEGAGAAAGAAVGEGAQGAKVEGALASGGGGVLGDVEGEAGKVGKFSGLLGKLGKFAGPLTKMMKPLSLGIRGIGAAVDFAMGPWGILIMTLLPILLPLLIKLNNRFHITDKIFTAVKWTVKKLGDMFKWLWQKVITPLFKWVQKNWPLLLGILLGPFGLVVVEIIKHWQTIWDFLKGVPARVTGFLSGMWDAVTSGLRTVWQGVQTIWGNIVTWVRGRPAAFGKMLRHLWDMFVTGLRLEYQAAKLVWTKVVDWVKGFPAQFARLLGKVWDIFSAALRLEWRGLRIIWGNIVNWVQGFPQQFIHILSSVWNVLKNSLVNALTDMKNFWTDHVWPWITGLGSKVGGALKNIFLGLANGFVTAVNWLGGKMQKYLFGPLNTVLGKFGVKSITVNYQPLDKLTSFAEGGPVTGPGGPKSDSILARVSNGEYILPTAATKKLGRQNLDFMREHGEFPTGGLFGSILHKAESVVGAVKDGAEFALKWVVGRFADQVEGHNMFGDIAVGLLRSIADNISSFGKNQDQKAAASAQSGSDYKGPPTGWTYAVPKPTHSFNYPGHNPPTALDIEAATGTPVRASSGGKISTLANLGNTSYGRYIIISHASGWQTLYGHMSRQTAKLGQVVKPGQLIGYSGATGGVTGPHLHLEITKSPGSSYSPDTHSEALRRGLLWPYRYGGPWGEGGVMPATQGGVLGLIAEAGRAERITPLDREGFTPAEREILKRLDASLGEGGKGDTYHVHPTPGMDETALADLVARRVAWNRRRGVRR